MSHADVRIDPICEGVKSFGVGHTRHHCGSCNGLGYRLLAISPWRWKWQIPCQFCRSTGWHPIGNPRELAATLLRGLEDVRRDLNRTEGICASMRLYGVRADQLERVFQFAGFRRRLPIQTDALLDAWLTDGDATATPITPPKG